VLKTFVVALVAFTLTLRAAIPLNCPAGVPLGEIRLKVEGEPGRELLPLRSINRLGEGDTITYTPIKLRLNPKGGKVALVVSPAPVKPGDPAPKELPPVKVLEPLDADKPGSWKMPFRVGVAALVYGPEGLNIKRVKAFLSSDDDLIVQLADYAEKTAQAEWLINAVASGTPLNPTQLDAALNGLGTQAGITGIDRTLPKDQQLAAILGRVNPTLAGVDPVAPDLTVRTQAVASVVTAVAGMFLGSPVGLAAGGTLLAMNLRTMMFPGTQFRSSFAQLPSPDSSDLDLCGKREPPRPRTKIAYLWAARIPNAKVPTLTVGTIDHLPQGHTGHLSIAGDAHLIDRAHQWKLTDLSSRKDFPVKVHSSEKGIAVDLAGSQAEPGVYQLSALWDWDRMTVTGALYVVPVDNLSQVRISPDSQDQLHEERGRTTVQAEGADFEFIQQVTIQKTGDLFRLPAPLPFALPEGPGRGPQERLSFELDTRPLSAGEYTLFLTEIGGIVREVPLKVLPREPKIDNAPLEVILTEEWQPVTLEGDNLDQIERLEARNATFQLGPVKGHRLEASIRLSAAAKPGQVTDLLAFAQNVSKPAVLPNAVHITGPAPKILSAKSSLAGENNIPVHEGELPAGSFVSISLAVGNVIPETKIHLRCNNSSEGAVTLRVGEKSGIGSAQALSAGELFLSFDPGTWQAGCAINAVLDNASGGQSKPFPLGKVIRVPHVEAFELTEEKEGDNYIGKLTGTDLENIAQVGWTAAQGITVSGLPVPTGKASKQSLKIALPWPAPTPHAALFIWFRNETVGRQTQIRY
jgi:hypothetical protein